jgi:predicted dehydrogenase/threonine dehydrogenase-like Zn-dependent dehydrogenase
MLLEFGRAGWLDKARQQPDKVRQAITKVQTDGLLATLDSIQAKLDQPVSLGYSNAGLVLDVGHGVSGFGLRDRVMSNGAHAEVVHVPRNLCARIPVGVSDESASFTVIGAIALQGIRLAQPALGESFCVMGLGLIGLLAVQILRANGCRVVAIDPDRRRLELARLFGAIPYSRGESVDGVLITAATRSSEPVHQAAQMCRKRGRIILVGVTGLELSRDDFYKKELTFQVSCSYGPGRYDASYEEQGHDYPFPYVRWTAQRNFDAVLQLMAERKLDVAPLITHRFPFEHAQKAYEVVLGGTPHLGILLEFPHSSGEELLKTTVRVSLPKAAPVPVDGPSVAFIGAGQHALKSLLPALKEAGVRLRLVADGNGVAALHAAKRFGFELATTNTAALADASVDTVFIATRHDSHGLLVCQALSAGKNVFVEKPFAINGQQLDEIESLYRSLPEQPLLMVGFNRRFSRHAARLRELLRHSAEPKAMVMTVNAGWLPADHWTLDPEVGGGRVIGEGCHFVDLLRFLCGSPILSSAATKVSGDTLTINLTFADGSCGTVHYFSNGHRSFPKERLEIFCGGRVLELDNFRSLTGRGWPAFHHLKLWRQDKGHAACVSAFIHAVRSGGPSPIAFEELAEVTRVTLDLR